MNKNRIELVLPLPVSINKLYMNQYVYDKELQRKVPSGKRILTQEGLISKKQMQKYAKKQLKLQQNNWDYEFTKTGYIYMNVTIYFNRRGRDDDNIYKLSKDSLEKIVYDNDSRVLVGTRRILFDVNNPRIEVEFMPVEFIGIFDDAESLDQFESACKGCSRYARNCSILRKAKEGFIQDEIDGGIGEVKECLKYSEIKSKK